MAAVIRVLMVLSVALLPSALLLPLERSVHVEFSLDQPPPMWVFGAFVLLVGVVTGAAAWSGLVRFRRWGRPLALSYHPLVASRFQA